MLKSAVFPYGKYWSASRLRTPSVPDAAITASEFLILVTAGVLAASAVAFIPLQLRIPGHAILRASLPIVLGIAIVPRQFAGTISGVSAAFMAGVFLVLGVGNLQAAALTALLAIGPAIDLAMRRARGGGWPLYLRFASAGIVANLLAFAVRWGVASLELDRAGPHRLTHIGFGALVSFTLCGLVAGLVSAIVCFRGSPKAE